MPRSFSGLSCLNASSYELMIEICCIKVLRVKSYRKCHWGRFAANERYKVEVIDILIGFAAKQDSADRSYMRLVGRDAAFLVE